MKVSSWQECVDFSNSKEVSPDQLKVESLIKTAKDRIKYSIKELIENNSNFIFEDYYSSILELIHALVLNAGFKVKNHICLGFYIRDVLKREDLFILFDDCRYKRNSLIYYGSRMDFETAKNTIKKCKILIKEIKKLLKIN